MATSSLPISSHTNSHEGRPLTRKRDGTPMFLKPLLLAHMAFAMAISVTASAQEGTVSAVVFDKVTVVDVETGTRALDQRVVVTGNRITAVGASGDVRAPKGAQVVDASGKYLIPGLWDVHVHHASDSATSTLFQHLFLANGITGIRDAGTTLPLPVSTQWVREVIAGTRIGPARQFFSGQSLADTPEWEQMGLPCDRSQLPPDSPQTCVLDEVDAVRYIDSIKALGATAIKTRSINTDKLYYAIAREAKRRGLVYGGHIQHGMPLKAEDAADSGVSFLEHMNASANIGFTPTWDADCLLTTYHKDEAWDPGTATVDRCRPVAAHLAKKNTWFVPTLTVFAAQSMTSAYRILAIAGQMRQAMEAFWSGTPQSTTIATSSNWLRGPVVDDTVDLPRPDSIGIMSAAQKAGLPTLAGTDEFGSGAPPGFGLHAELAMLVAEGMTPLTALQSATIGPAKAFRMADSLGTVAAGKVADLVLLDADPLADITNTTTIRAVMANGRYFERSVLDGVLADVRDDPAATGLWK